MQVLHHDLFDFFTIFSMVFWFNDTETVLKTRSLPMLPFISEDILGPDQQDIEIGSKILHTLQGYWGDRNLCLEMIAVIACSVWMIESVFM